MKDASSSTVSTLSIALFVLSIAWFRQKKNEAEEEFDYSINNISARGAAAMKKGSSYWESFLLCLQNPCDPQSNPEGHIALCTAENKLVQETFAARLMQQGTAITAFSDSSSYCHGSFLGLPSAREAAAYFLHKRFWKRHIMGMHRMHRVDSMTSPLDSLNGGGSESMRYNGYSHISPEYIAFGAGVNSLISQLFYSIATAGDVVLIPAPYYSAFDYDAKTIAGLVPHPVYMDNPIVGPSPTDLENAAQIVEKVSLLKMHCAYNTLYSMNSFVVVSFCSKENE